MNMCKPAKSICNCRGQFSYKSKKLPKLSELGSVIMIYNQCWQVNGVGGVLLVKHYYLAEAQVS